jgi:exodeoxyribonuclease-5
LSLTPFILSALPAAPTASQTKAIDLIEQLVENRGATNATLLLKGYAGTGKTTLLSALVRAIPKNKFQTVLLAPTGRAAKVMASYSGQGAATIHRHIYRKETGVSGSMHFSRKRNMFANTIFIVDEASMLSDDSEFGNNGLLGDLISYVFEQKNNRLILCGDTAQLPPVGKTISPALDKRYLESHFSLDLLEVELTDVVRQAQASGILYNATKLRNDIRSKATTIHFTTGFKDFYKMTSDRLEDGLRYAYDNFGREETIVVCRSNKSATGYNRYIRQAIFFTENELDAGDLLMSVRNNYTILPSNISSGFIANGDFLEIRKVLRYQDQYGFRFADIEAVFRDFPEFGNFQLKIMLDTLYSNTPNLEQDKMKELYAEIEKEYADIATKQERMEAIRKDPFLNALQVKFAYALTCHKAQGGQWHTVFIEQGYLTDDKIDIEFLRWLYTAITRGKNQVFLVNFHPKFFEGIVGVQSTE